MKLVCRRISIPMVMQPPSSVLMPSGRPFSGTPDADHRHVLEHSQLADMAQFKQMKALGICVNLFANHIHYFGDVHYTQTVGPDWPSG